MELPRKSLLLKRPRVVATKGKPCTASDSEPEDSAEDPIGQHEPNRTRKAKRVAWRRVRPETGRPDIAEGAKDRSIGISGEENGNGDILAPISFNPEKANRAEKERDTRNRNQGTSSNFAVKVKRIGPNARVQDEQTHMHTGEKPHQCNVCGKTFSQSYHLVTHTWTHTGEKPHQCSVCGKTFRQRSHLATHTRTHTGEKPHQCNMCGKTFSQRSLLATHTRTHTGEKPHQCSVCGKTFSIKFALVRHTTGLEKSFQ